MSPHQASSLTLDLRTRRRAHLTPSSNRGSAGALDSLDTLMESLAPPVVVVVVTHDPGPWFETTLKAIDEQNYPETSVLVVDAASSQDPTSRVASILPEAFVSRLPSNEGFGASANQAAAMVEGADFLVFCHDDVAPEPEALRHMVEEAYRSNAGVVGPKFVDWDEPERILHVGVQVDKSGAVVDRVERCEVDHGQHDAVRDVFSTPGGFTLVRSDLFAELGGFDPHIVVMGEDLDLCWRAQIAGARVIVAPDARVRHLELLASGQRDAPSSVESAGSDGRPTSSRPISNRSERFVSMQELQRRAELHAAIKAYGPLHRARVIPQIALLAIAEMLVLSVVGRAARAREIAHAWAWNFRIRKATRVERRQVQAIRRVTDADVRLGQIRGSARVNKYLRLAFTQGLRAAHLGLDDPIAGPALCPSRSKRERRTKGFASSYTEGDRLDRDLPRSAARDSSIVEWGAASPRPVPENPISRRPRLTICLGPPPVRVRPSRGCHPGDPLSRVERLPAVWFCRALLQTVLVVACLPLGAFGAARLSRAFGGGWAPVVGAACYLAVPLPYDDIATGRLDALFAYAAVPWIMLALAKASDLEPLRDNRPLTRPWRTARRANGQAIAGQAIAGQATGGFSQLARRSGAPDTTVSADIAKRSDPARLVRVPLHSV